MDQIKVFLDSDVLVSALLSKTGASFEIVKNAKIVKVISKTIEEEIHTVASRLDIAFPIQDLLQETETITLNLEKARLSQKYIPYVLDIEDSHVVAGAQKAGVTFLLTHNIKHYHLAKIKNDLDINVMKPGTFLQYFRTRKQ